MKSSVEEITPILGTAMDAGLYAGRIRIGEQVYALIVAPKAEGDLDDTELVGDYDDVPAAKSYNDGLANTKALAEAGSEVAKLALASRIGGKDDWYIPSQDELEIIYRNLKPTTDENSGWGRSGINVSAVIPTYPYSPDLPLQTQSEAFQADGSEALDPVWYWSSTQHASASSYAWSQHFSDGYQNYYNEHDSCRVRLVRRLPI